MTTIVPTISSPCDIITHPQRLEATMHSLTLGNDNSGQVIAFPVARQAATVRRTAEAVNDRHGLAADRYWRSMISDMRARMVATGMNEEAVECELRAFSDSVFPQIGQRCA